MTRAGNASLLRAAYRLELLAELAGVLAASPALGGTEERLREISCERDQLRQEIENGLGFGLARARPPLKVAHG